MLDPEKGCGCSLMTMIALPHSVTAVPAAMLAERGSSLGYTEFNTLQAIANFGKYRALALAGLTLILEKTQMVDVASGGGKLLLLAAGMLAFDAVATSIYKLRAEKRYYSML